MCWLQNGVAGFRASATVQDRLHHLLWSTWSELLVLVVCLLAPRHTPFPSPTPSPPSPTGCVFQTQVSQWKAPTSGSLEDRKRRSHSVSPLSLPWAASLAAAASLPWLQLPPDRPAVVSTSWDGKTGKESPGSQLSPEFCCA